jgi:hypothetical protein
MSSPQAIQDQQKFEFYKLEYERATIRYENIYNAMWQIFQYMAAISGALLAFGGDRIEQHWLAVLVCLPLTFWFFATYLPLDRYGNNALAHLKKLEASLNGDYKTNLSHFSDFDARRKEAPLGRVKTWMVIMVVALFLTIGSNLCTAIRNGTSWIRQTKSEVKIITVSTEELKNLLEGSRSTSQSPIAPVNQEKKP